MDGFTPEEIHWIEIIEKDEKMLDELIMDRRDKAITERFIQLLEKILKYENLRVDQVEYNKTYRRLVRIRRNIPTKALDRAGIEYVISGGLYMVQNVTFLDPELVKKYIKKPYPSTIKELGLPDGLSYALVKIVKHHDTEIGVTLSADSHIVQRYLGTQNSSWDYVII